MICAASAGEVAELRRWPSFESAASRCSIRFRSVISLAIVSDAVRPWNMTGLHLISTSMRVPSFFLCRHTPAKPIRAGVLADRSVCRYSISAGTSSARADVTHFHREKLLARIAVMLDRRVIDFQERKRLVVEHPHGRGVAVENQAILLFALSQLRFRLACGRVTSRELTTIPAISVSSRRLWPTASR